MPTTEMVMSNEWLKIGIEVIGWASTIAFLISIVTPQRHRLHQFGIFTAITTCIYAYAHGATAIWVKWILAFFFHIYMLWKLRNKPDLGNFALPKES